MENGTIKEHGRPNDLLTNKDSELCKEVNEVDPSVVKKFKKKVLLGGKKWKSGDDKKGSSGGNPFLSLINKDKK